MFTCEHTLHFRKRRRIDSSVGYYEMTLLHSVDIYQQMYVLWTKYCTELDSLDHLQCNNTICAGMLWISGLSGVFIGEFL